MTAIALPTATSSPAAAVIPASVPLAGDSTSTVALSVSTSISGSPFAMCAPSLFSQRTSLPVSWATPKAGMTTSVDTQLWVLAFVPSRFAACTTAVWPSRFRFDCVSRVVGSEPPAV